MMYFQVAEQSFFDSCMVPTPEAYAGFLGSFLVATRFGLVIAMKLIRT